MMDYNLIKSGGVILGIIGALFYFFFKYFFSDEKTFQGLISIFKENKPLSNYHRYLEKVLEVAQNFFGKPWRFTSYDRILSIAFCYPAIFFLLNYLISGQFGVGEFNMLTESGNWLKRVGLVLLLLGSNGVLFTLLSRPEQSKAFFYRLYPFRSNRLKIGLSIIAALIFGFVCVLVGYDFSGIVLSLCTLAILVYFAFGLFGSVIVGSCSLVLIVTSFDPVIGMVIFLIAYLMALIVDGGGSGTIAIIIIGIPFGLLGVVFGGGYEYLWLTFFLFVLPIANSIFDFISFEISRYLTIKTSKSESKFIISVWLIIDAIAAIVLLIGTAYTIPIFVELFNIAGSRFVKDFLPIDWKGMAMTAKVSPLSHGLSVTLMLYSTLIWTIVHICIAMSSFIMAPLGRRPLLKILLKDDVDNIDRTIGASLLTVNFVLSGLSIVAIILLIYYLKRDVSIAAWLYEIVMRVHFLV